MKVLNGSIYDLEGKPLIAKAIIELDEAPGVSMWGGHFRLPQPAPPIHVFKPQCVLKLEDGRRGTVTVGRADRHAAYFLGIGKLDRPAA